MRRQQYEATHAVGCRWTGPGWDDGTPLVRSSVRTTITTKSAEAPNTKEAETGIARLKDN
jgi:hypothetical protein